MIAFGASKGENLYDDLLANCLMSSQGMLNALAHNSNKIEQVKQSLMQCISSICGSASNFKFGGRRHPSSSNLPPESAATLSSNNNNNNRDSTAASASGPGECNMVPRADGDRDYGQNEVDNKEDDCIVCQCQ